jgi:hypothetical protein
MMADVFGVKARIKPCSQHCLCVQIASKRAAARVAKGRAPFDDCPFPVTLPDFSSEGCAGNPALRQNR